MSLFSDANETWYERLLEKCMLKFCAKNYEQEYRSSEKRNCSDLLCIKMWTTMNNDKNITHHILTKNIKYVAFIILFFSEFQFRFSFVFPFATFNVCTSRTVYVWVRCFMCFGCWFSGSSSVQQMHISPLHRVLKVFWRTELFDIAASIVQFCYNLL